MRREVVITGLGAVSPMGVGVDALWDGMLEGRCAIGPITRFDPAGIPCQLAGQVPASFSIRDFVPKHYRKATKVMAPDIELAVAAAQLAVTDAGITTRAAAEEGAAFAPTVPPERVGCLIGAGLIPANNQELTLAMSRSKNEMDRVDFAKWGTEGMQNLTPLWMLKYLPNMLACHVTIVHDAQGPSNTITAAEVSGILSVGESRSVIERNAADVCFSGGGESRVHPVTCVRMQLAGWTTAADAASPGDRAVRPYDAASPASVLGEGSGIVIVEEKAHAARRGARVYARVAGFGGGQTGMRGTTRDHAVGLRGAIDRALVDAGMTPGDIDAIAPGALGVPGPDAIEAEGLRAVFGARLASIPMITVTPAIGNSIAGAGALCIVVAAKAIDRQALPARIHGGSWPQDLQAGPTKARDARIRAVLVCGVSWGGQCGALILTRPA
jgi:3-oxoacyl-[acyl-carrier-protein] synthase II